MKVLALLLCIAMAAASAEERKSYKGWELNFFVDSHNFVLLQAWSGSKQMAHPVKNKNGS